MESESFTILIAENDAVDLEVLKDILSPVAPSDENPAPYQWEISVSPSGEDALERIRNELPDLVLLNSRLPDANGIDVLRALKSTEMTRHIPVLLLAGISSREDEESALTLGAADYIAKPVHRGVVRARVFSQLCIIQRMRTMETFGLMDTLSGLPNRRSFNNKITTEWGRSIRNKTVISMLMIDIDRFKIFNDTYGHQQGDEVIKAVAAGIKSSVRRATDFYARWGGEEFAVVLPETDLRGAMVVAENIRARIESTGVEKLNGEGLLYITVSVGAASATPEVGESPEGFIGKSDRALYLAKEAGRNCCMKIE
ncbi:MAG: diguanylate cyclase [Clostridiales bacterium]|nr:diguanylate cyclase [Clostridiales bacterium]